MEDVFTPILQTAIESREKLRAELKRVEQIIALSTPAVNMLEFPCVAPKEYLGRRPMEALESYLRTCTASKVPLKQAITALLYGGVDPGQARGRQKNPAALLSHTLRIGIPNKTWIFQWEPEGLSPKSGKKIVQRRAKDEDIFVWLAPTANEPRPRKRYAKKPAERAEG